jgi:hypothetical protein
LAITHNSQGHNKQQHLNSNDVFFTWPASTQDADPDLSALVADTTVLISTHIIGVRRITFVDTSLICH